MDVDNPGPLAGIRVLDLTAVRRPAPLPGQHTREVLAEAGLTDAEITALEQAGLLRATERPSRARSGQPEPGQPEPGQPAGPPGS